MAVLSKGTDFSDGDQVTSANLDNLVDNATFVSGPTGTTDDTSLEVNGSGRLQVKDGGITAAKLSASAITTAKLADSTSTTTGITFSKIRYIKDMSVIGNVSGASAQPAEVDILDEDDFASDSATSLATQQSIKAYVDGALSAPSGTTIATSGNLTLPGGVIVKFGQFQLTGDSATVVTFPTAFPNNCFTVVSNLNDGNVVGAVLTGSITTSSFTANRDDALNGTTTHNFIAIGN